MEDTNGNPRILDDSVDIGAVEGPSAGIPARMFVVTSLEDAVADDGDLTFREAFEAAARNQPCGDAPGGSFSEKDVIRFAPGLSGTIFVNDELTVFGELRIEGPGSEFLSFDAEGSGRVPSVESDASVDLSGITITGGTASGRGCGLQPWGTDDL